MTRTTVRARARHPGRSPGQRGVALVIVLWMLALLTVIANGVALSSRTGVQAAGNLVALARAEAAADAGIYRAIAELMEPEGNPLRWQASGLEYRWEFGEASVRVSMRDEAAKIDLNIAPALLLAGLFRAVGAADEAAQALSDAVVDWRDPDDLRSLHGAERADYAAAGKPYGPANAAFEAVEELRQVLGMNETLFRAVRDLVTVHSYRGTVNAAVAPRAVLLALPGATPDQVDAYIERRRLVLERGLPPPPFPLAPALPGVPTFYSVQAEAVLGDNTRFAREAVVRLTGNASKPFVILAWRAALPGATPPSDSDSTSPNGLLR